MNSYYSIKDVEKTCVELKTGYICDIQSYSLKLKNGDHKNIIVKINNTNNELSKIAAKLNLYSNEINFYEQIYPYVNILTPKFYNTLEFDELKI